MQKKIILYFLGFVAVILLLFAFAPPLSNAVCYCVDPVGDNCVCTTPASGGATGEFEGIEVQCTGDPDGDDYTAEQEVLNFWARRSPVCGTSAEVLPSCARAPDSNYWYVCWGNEWTDQTPFTEGQQDYQMESSFTFSGRTYGVQCTSENPCGIHVCSSIATCCGNMSNCNPDDIAEEAPDACEAMTNYPPDPDICGPIAGASGAESRLWFPHTRLIASLSSWGQSMFNPIQPFELEERPTESPFDFYFYTAFSKNATPEEIDDITPDNLLEWVLSLFGIEGIGYESVGPITTKVTRHQGIDDGTIVYNQDDNNSSMIVGNPAPQPLFSFGITDDDNIYNDDPACYIPEDRNNPGDDLLGPKQTAELLFTAVITYTGNPAPGRPVDDSDPSDDCLYSGDFTSDITYGEWTDEDCRVTCCSASGPNGSEGLGCNLDDPPSDDCVEADPNFTCGEIGTPYESYGYACNDGETDQCCANSNIGCTDAYGEGFPVEGSCYDLGPLQQVAGGGESQVFDKTPMVEYLYQTMLEGSDSLWHRFMPYDPDYEFEDIPSSTTFSASAQVASPLTSGTVVEIANGQTSTPTLYFPKIGTLDKYWLKDFQTLLRPDGFDVIDADIPGTDPDNPEGDGVTCVAPHPDSAEFDAILAEARGRGEAAARVPAEVLRTIYYMESYGYWPGEFDCVPNALGYLGYMQVGDTEYNDAVAPDQRMQDIRACGEYYPNSLSRCNSVDAMEIAARVLLMKIGQWNYETFQPLGSMTSTSQVYCGSCRYYGSTNPDGATNNRGNDLGVPDHPDGGTSYCEVVGHNAGFFTDDNGGDYPDPRPGVGDSCWEAF